MGIDKYFVIIGSPHSSLSSGKVLGNQSYLIIFCHNCFELSIFTVLKGLCFGVALEFLARTSTFLRLEPICSGRDGNFLFLGLFKSKPSQPFLLRILNLDRLSSSRICYFVLLHRDRAQRAKACRLRQDIPEW